MNGLFLHTGNRLEALADELASLAGRPMASPFVPEVVMVQSLGMRRWISLRLAKDLGVCLNFEFPFPQKFLNDTLRGLAPEMAPEEAFSVESMTWKIHRLLPSLLTSPEFSAVRHYAGDGDALKLYQLASRTARLFDQYLVYRPQMLLAWERNETQGSDDAPEPESAAWQAVLWRALNIGHLVHFAAALDKISRGLPDGALLPERVSLFGISSLPPAQIRVFFQLAAVRPVHLFLLAPSSEYHGDDLTPKQRARRNLAASGASLGNPLLTSLGRLNAHFTEVLLEADEQADHRLVDASESFSEPDAATLLHRMQRDILHARNPAADGVEEDEPPALSEAAAVSPDDDSLRIHSCHSPMREVEVLYDQLLAMFDEDRTLLPRDVLVMTPDIEKYAPFVHAVFGYPEKPGLRIPFSVADRQPRSESLTIDTFLRVLDLPGARCTARDLFTLLQSAPLRRKFHFDEAGLEQIRQWIDASGIRWGLDDGHRAALGFPAFTENTWRHGLDRLLLGYAIPGDNRTLFEGILPHDVEGTGEELLGRLASALEALFTTVEALGQPRPLAEWPEALEAALERLFDSDDDANEARAMRTLRELASPNGALASAAREEGRAAGEHIVEFEVIRENLKELLTQAEQRGQFLTGGVTFCALKPMRSIPARVIWLLGMDDGAFPRKPQPVQFDLIARQWKLGDRSVREDDRYVFLEALLSARDRLCISYLGRSHLNNEAAQPSVVVRELLDYVEQTTSLPRSAWIVEHRLQAFSSRYFDPESPLFSYSQANAAASRQGIAREERPFLAAPLPEPEADERAVRIERLVEFFANPAAFFLRRRLGVRLEESDQPLAESEPMEIGSLAAYGIRQELFEPRLKGNSIPGRDAFTARALLPPGSMGARHFEKADRAARSFLASVQPFLVNPQEPKLIELRLGEFTLTGALEPIYNGRPVLFRPARLKAKDRFRAWIKSLAWCAAEEAAGREPQGAILAGEGETVEFAALAPTQLLERLLAIYWRGLCEPVPFFPASSLQYATVCQQPPSSKRSRSPLEAARLEWAGGFNKNAECDDPAYRLCFGRGDDPLNADFEALAMEIAGGMLAAQREWEG